LYDLNVTSLGWNTYEFKSKRKKIILKPLKLKSNVGNNKKGTVTDKNNKTPYYLVTSSHFSAVSPIDRSAPRLTNFFSLLHPPLGIPSIVTTEPPGLHLHELHDHNTRKITINNYNISMLQNLTRVAGIINR